MRLFIIKFGCMIQNIKNNRAHRVDLALRNDEYYDLALFNGGTSQAVTLCPILSLMPEKTNAFPLSIPSFWKDGKNEGTTLENIGLTGIDNGLISYRKDRIEDAEFFKIATESKIHFEKDDMTLKMQPVGGNTLQYDYPMTISDGAINFKGGFLQGMFATPDGKVSLLPKKLCGKEWNLSFKLKTNNAYANTGRSLNMKHPENEGIFFFMGVRAENKFDKLYYSKKGSEDEELFNPDGYFSEEECNTYLVPCDKDGCNCAIESDYFLPPEETPESVNTNNGFDITESGQKEIATDNKYLWFDRTKNGFNIHTWDEEAEHRIQLTERPNINLYPWLNRTPTGYTTNNIGKIYATQASETRTSEAKDIANNAFALKLNSDGSISYRLSTLDCDSEKHMGLLEERTLPALFKDNEWFDLRVRIVPTSAIHMKLMFYVNGLLKFISKELPTFNFRKLNELDEKQEGVPFNISLGGGTQGLCEMIDITNYMKNPTEAYFMENNFCGTFLGDMKSFSFSVC